MATWNDFGFDSSYAREQEEERRRAAAREAEQVQFYRRLAEETREASQRQERESRELQRELQAESERLARRSRSQSASSVANEPQTRTKATKEWSTLAALLGFLGTAGAIYAETEPEVGGAMLGGIFGAYLAGRFYKVILWIGVAILILKMISAS